MVRVLTNSEVEQCLDMTTALDAVEHAFRAEAVGDAVTVPRSDLIIPLGKDEAYVFKTMSGAIADIHTAALRVQSDRIRWEGGRKHKLGMARDGQYVEYIQVYDTRSCEPIVVMPDGHASKMRVGATNAVAAKHMAPRGTERLGLLGAGRQAGTQLWGFSEVFDLEEIRVYSPTEDHRKAFARRWDASVDADVVAVDSALTAVQDADVLACASNSMRPVFDADWIEPGMHLSAIKNPEVPAEALDEVDWLCVTSKQLPSGPNNYAPRGSAFGDQLTLTWGLDESAFDSADELSAVVADDKKRSSPDETTFFLNNIGVGVQFAAVGSVVAERAAKEEFGSDIQTQHFLQAEAD